MLRARLWYGPAGHGLTLDRVARYLGGPLACRLSTDSRSQFGREVARLMLHDPIAAVIEQHRRPEVSAEAADLVTRLPVTASPALAQKLGACTARLDIHDAPGHRLAPASGPARSVFMPLAFAMDGIVEEVQGGRLLFFGPPEEARPAGWVARMVSGLLRPVLRR
ncbi:hypothetical protein [Rhodovulum steppense]|uniref:Uncharacterized protein n=1 Tax=Rhodovulum steppense TaxID=540251 RepID=A0A4R1YZ31_9RHOB|nr:hypothetical protein [Rhodovulum steppense]TCM86498.1 hypothetical protein EV216_10447 [Rhodovulum steppense]